VQRSIFYILLLSFILVTGKTSAQNVSNEGTDFWAVFPTHVPSGNAFARMSVFISSKSKSSGNIIMGGISFPFNVLPNNIAEIDIPRSFAYINDSDADKILSNRSIHIVVDNGQPKVAAYAHIYARARSEAYLILPVEAHGKKYFAMDATGASAPNTSRDGAALPGMPFLVVLATADNTVINIKKPLDLFSSQITLPKAGDVYEILSPSTLSGTEVEIDNPTSTCKTFAVFSGHSGIAIDGSSYDPMAQQLYPVASWGRVYGFVPFKNRISYAKIIASEDNTTVKIDNNTVGIFNKGDIYNTAQLSEFVLISADKPISTAQITYSQDAISASANALQGDPDMVILNPIEYSIKNITVFSSNLEAINERYINIFIKTKFRNSFNINGSPPTSTWETVASDPTYSYLQEQVTDRSLTLTADDNFNAIAYGFGDHESYAYSAGTNLATNQFLLLKNKVTNQETIAACQGQPSDFVLTLPYLLTRIIWKSENGTVIYDDTNPSPTQSVVSGQTLYKYLAPVNMTFNVLGQFKLSATATIAQSAGSCMSGDLELNFIVDVDPLPTAAFSSVATGCTDSELSFTDQSTSNIQQKQVNKWLWDFGDGVVSADQNPKHTYTTSGTFTVSLTVGGENGCLSNALQKTIEIKPKVIALFESQDITCAKTNIFFTDKSSVAVGNIIKWVWNMGDGKAPLQKTTSTPFSYQFDVKGTYTVSVVAYGDNGCISLPYAKQITVTALPINDFEVPDVCVKDGETIFKNLSTNADGTTNGLTYAWYFDDPAPGAINTSTAFDGKHQFTIARDYNIILTVTNENGCVVTTKKVFTVNGKDPVANYEIQNKSSLCSNQSFTVLNKATVDFGKITRIDWFINGAKVNISPTPQPSYQFKVPEATSDQSITLIMIAFSGTSCSSVYQEPPFTLLASPSLEFDKQAPLCQNDFPVQLLAREISNLSGKGIFTGKGVSAAGIFNPELAGNGDWVITYTYNATNGCHQSVDQTITVYPKPVVYAGKDEYILIGGERELQATAKGNGLTYKWTPSIGLNRDDILNPIVKPEKDMSYILTVTSKDGCVVSDQVYVYMLNEVNAPNSFTPNADGVNDVWNVKYLDSYPKVTVEIFNRNGQRIYFSRGYSVPFDGNFNNQSLPVGTYYYLINPNNGGKSITGNVTIIR
jgi:gliding motility-associated-like protein